MTEKRNFMVSTRGFSLGTIDIYKEGDSYVMGRLVALPTSEETLRRIYEGEERTVGKQNQPEDYIPPTSPPPQVRNGGIGVASRKLRHGDDVELRKFAVKQALKTTESKQYQDGGDALVKVAEKIYKFITDTQENK